MELIFMSKSKGGKEELYLCPFCVSRIKSPDHPPGHLQVNKEKGVYNCFRCGASPKSTGYIPVIPQYPQRIFKEEDEKKKTRLPDSFVSLNESSEDFFPYYMQYAVDRGVTKDHIERFQIGFILDSYSPFYGRLIFQFFDDSGKLQFIQGRAVSDDMEPPYWSNGQKILAKSFEGSVDEGVVVEGIFDLIKSSQVVPTGVIFGNKVRDERMKLMIRRSFKKKIFIALDADMPGALISFIKEFPDREVCPIFLRKKDFGSLEKEEIQKILARVNYGKSGTYDSKLSEREKLL